ncbi:unnamed protein product [Blepharisma stoltei]|uniref:Uncharacterized protein n=1 Tax=Blepharisma stoltei TaxID=1481888 RepID=A0AAU9INX1_9CILI|nr:unnamed protein product [Blepharisma stoltei]
MLVRYLFLFPTVLSIMIQRELGSIYLTEGESYELYLLDYFSGNNLSFAISDSNMTTGSAMLENKCEFEMLAFLPFQNSSWNETWTHSSLQPLISWKPIFESYEIIIWYNLKYVVFYNFFSERGEIEMLWNGFIDSEYLSPQIEDIKIYSSDHGQISYALIWVKQQENALIWRNDFYYMNLSNLSALVNPKWVNISEATYASNIILTHGAISSITSIYLEFSSSPSAIYVYNITNIEEPILTQVISKYYGISINKLSVASMYMDSIYLYVLDANFGVIGYSMFNYRGRFFTEYAWNYYGYVGTLSSMWKSYNDCLGVISSSGILFVKNSLQQLSFSFLGGEGMNWENGCLQIIEDYYFVQSINGVLSVALSRAQPLQILYNIDIRNLIGERFEATGQWGFFINEDIFYLRFDMDGLRIYKAYLEEWRIKIWGNSTYHIQITAKDQNDDIISNNLYVNSIPQKSQEILQIDMYRPTSISPIELIADGQNGTSFSIVLNDYFSGPNLEFTIVDLPDLNTASFEIISMNKLKLYQNVSLSSNITNFVISGENIVSFYDDKVIIVDRNDDDIIIDVTNPIKFLWSRDYIIYSKPNQNSFLISTYLSFEGKIQDIPSEIDCIFFLITNWNLICADSHQIDIYYNNDTYYYAPLVTLTGEQFEKGSSWNITDLTVSFSTPSILYIYIIDNDLGAVIIDLKSIIETTEPYNYYGKVSGAKNAINTGSEICFVFENFIEIYGYSLEYSKTILTNIYEPIVGTYGESNMIYLITSSALYIFDSGQPSHNSLFYTLPISNPSLLSFGLFNWGDMRIANFNPDKHYVEIYTSPCPNKEFNEGCSFYYEFYMHIGNSDYLKDFSLQTSISIAAFNKENLLKETFPINLIINGNFPWYKEENWENNKNIPYNERYELDLSKFFEGQNILMALSVNGNYSFNETVDNWPAVIPQRTELLGRYDLNKHYGKTNHIIIPNTEIAVILSFSELFIIDATGLTNKALVLNLTEISNITDLICNFMEVFPHTQNNLALLITSCIYRIPEIIEYKSTTTYISEFAYGIALWELDYINFEIIKYKLLNTYSDHNYLKVAPLDAQSFEILAFYIDDTTQNYINNI